MISMRLSVSLLADQRPLVFDIQFYSVTWWRHWSNMIYTYIMLQVTLWPCATGTFSMAESQMYSICSLRFAVSGCVISISVSFHKSFWWRFCYTYQNLWKLHFVVVRALITWLRIRTICNNRCSPITSGQISCVSVNYSNLIQ